MIAFANSVHMNFAKESNLGSRLSELRGVDETSSEENGISARACYNTQHR